MARALNKNRLIYSRILVALALVGGLLSDTPLKNNATLYFMSQTLGLFLVAGCALGRVYATAFIGGAKNASLITLGPYSLCRNPLYFFSLMGVTGVGLLTGSLVITLMLLGGFTAIYKHLIDREEEHLSDKFGADFDAFKKRTPRLWPSFRNYQCPSELVFQPRFLTNAVRDAVWWFAPVPVFLASKILQDIGMYKSWFTLF